jgi:beta-glucosidase
VSIYATVCNTAGPAGSEVAQLYVGYPAAANEPPKLLKGFEKVAIAPGTCESVGFTLAASDLLTWNVVTQAWQLIPGTYTALVGSSCCGSASNESASGGNEPWSRIVLRLAM